MEAFNNYNPLTGYKHSFATMTHGLNMVLCNNLPDIDPDFYDTITWPDTMIKEAEREYLAALPNDTDANDREAYLWDVRHEIIDSFLDGIYQIYLLDCSDFEFQQLKTHYPNDFITGYCAPLDLHALIVYHYGTAWEGVPVDYYTNDDE